MDFKTSLKEIAQEVNAKLDEVLNEQTPYAKSFSQEITALWDSSSPLLREGKRLRAALVIIGHDLFNGNVDRNELLRIAVGIELIHSYLLVHDDIMDRASTRRGIATIHEQMKSIYHKEHDKDHVGTSVAICFGDILCNLGLHCVNTTKTIPAATIQKINILINEKIMDVAFGQIMDFMNAYKEPSRDDIATVYELKTGRYTYELPLYIGAILANATLEQMAALTAYAIPGGIAFQIMDDIIGTFGDEDTTGKSAASDLIEGKRTLLVLETMETGNQTEKLAIASVLGKSDATTVEIKKARDSIISSGSLENVRLYAKSLLDKSSHSLTILSNANEQAKEMLLGLNAFVLNREK